MIAALLFSYAFAQSVNLEQAFKNEMTSLSSQQSFLSQSLLNSKKAYFLEKKRLEKEIVELEKNVTEVSVKNEVNSEAIKLMGQGIRQNQQKKQSLLSTYKKAKLVLDKTQSDLAFSALKATDEHLPISIEVSQFQELANVSLLLLKKSTIIEPIIASYYSEDGELMNGDMIRYGRIAATLKNSILGPSEKGLLQQVSTANQNPNMIDLVIFDNLKSTPNFKKTARFWELIADQIPIVVLSMLMLLVLGLFGLFAKE